MSHPQNLQINDTAMRRQYDEVSKTWYFSVIDTVAIVSESSDPRNYWKVLKSRLQKGNSELVTACNQLKLPASDGKSYLTDVATSDVLLKIVETISPKWVAPFRLWSEKIESAVHTENSFPQFESTDEVVELPIDMYEQSGVLTIRMFIAGTNPEDIVIRTTHESLTVHGARKMNGAFLKEQSIVQELFYGNFSRTVAFTQAVELDRIEATLHHGLLTITIPLVDMKRVRIVKIKSI